MRTKVGLNRIVAVYRKADLMESKKAAPSVYLVNIPDDWTQKRIKDELAKIDVYFDDTYKTHWDDRQYFMREEDPAKWDGKYWKFLKNKHNSATLILEYYNGQFFWRN